MAAQVTTKPKSVGKMALGWIFLFVMIGLSVGIALLVATKDRRPMPEEPGIAFAIVFFVMGGFALLVGIGSYFVVLYTNCFIWNFTHPVWKNLRDRIYLANFFVTLAVILGVSFMVAPFVRPIIARMGVSPQMASFLPFVICLGVCQLVLVWFVIWAPLEKRVIRKRLAAKGISEAQMETGTYLGISDPAKSTFKRFGAVEEDIGMLWFDSSQLIYWGDKEDFAIQREDLLEIEQKMDAASTSALSGTAHVILRYRQPDSSERRIRLHCEGIYTQGGKSAAMNALAERIIAWNAEGPALRPPPPPARAA